MAIGPQEQVWPEIDGWRDVVEWFGEDPTFHDGEVVSIDLRRYLEVSTLVVVAERRLPGAAGRDHRPSGEFALLTFSFREAMLVRLEGWNLQNQIYSMFVKTEDDEHVLTLTSDYGVEGEIRARQMWVRIKALPDGALMLGADVK